MGQRRVARSKRGYTREYFKDRAELLAYQPWCGSCGSTERLTVDHIVPLSAGGAQDMSNYQVLCLRCNDKKGVRHAGST